MIASCRRPNRLLTLALLVPLALSTTVWGQAAKKKDTSAEDFPSATRTSLESFDGVYLTAYYWAAPKPGRDVPVIILLSERGRKQLDWFPFAKRLNDDGFAVITFDFRGNGESRQINPNIYRHPRDMTAERKGKAAAPPKGDQINEVTEFRSGRELKLWVNDIEAVKRFLAKENNQGKLNLKLLGMVAAGEATGHVALSFAELEFQDEGRQGWYRQGRDLGALVLLTPTWNYQGWVATTDLGTAAEKLPILILSSKAPNSESDASRLSRALRVPDKVGSTRTTDRPDSLWMKLDAKSAGIDLMRPPFQYLDATIHGFLKHRLVGNASNTWQSREIEQPREAIGFGSQRSPAATP